MRGRPERAGRCGQISGVVRDVNESRTHIISQDYNSPDQ